MSTFAPPVVATGVPPVLPYDEDCPHPLSNRLFRYYRARPGGDGNNVYYRIVSGKGTPAEVGTVTDADPVTTYDSNGRVLVEAWSDVAHVWYAGHAPETVTTAQRTALIAAGYTVVG